jgi:hypothetical protein
VASLIAGGDRWPIVDDAKEKLIKTKVSHCSLSPTSSKETPEQLNYANDARWDLSNGLVAEITSKNK